MKNNFVSDEIDVELSQRFMQKLCFMQPWGCVGGLSITGFACIACFVCVCVVKGEKLNKSVCVCGPVMLSPRPNVSPEGYLEESRTHPVSL